MQQCLIYSIKIDSQLLTSCSIDNCVYVLADMIRTTALFVLPASICLHKFSHYTTLTYVQLTKRRDKNKYYNYQHFVNENYDEGAIIFQKKTVIIRSDTPTQIAKKIHALEQEYFPNVIDSLLETDFD